MSVERGESGSEKKKVIREQVDQFQDEFEAVDMSDIDALLAAAADVSEVKPDFKTPESDFDLDAFLQEETELSDLREIGSLLRKDENKELIAPEQLLAEDVGVPGVWKMDTDWEDSESDKDSAVKADKKTDKKAEKEAAREAKKAAKEAAKQAKKAAREAKKSGKAKGETTENLEEIVDRVAKTSGGSLWDRVMSFLMQDEEKATAEEESLNLSDENLLILEALKSEIPEESSGSRQKDEEDAEKADSEKGKKKKEKKEKKAKKPPKAPKPKKQKVEDPEPPVKLSAKRIRLIALLGLSLTVFLISFTLLGADLIERKRAKREFYKGNYQESYQGLFGKKLSNSEEVIYYKSEVILKMRLQLKRYEWIAKYNQPAEALDSLIQSVALHPPLKEMALRWNAEEEMEELYGRLLAYLEAYGLTEEDAMEIAEIPDDLSYSKAIYEIVGGNGSSDQAIPERGGETAGLGELEELEDLLGEEELLPETNFKSE